MPKDSSVPPELDNILDTVLAYDPDKKEVRDNITVPTVKAWSSSVEDIFTNGSLRLDATHYDPDVVVAMRRLEDSGYELKPLSELATVELRGQFTRIWAKDERCGFKYLNATDLLSLMALGVPSGGGTRFLSHASETNVDALVVHEGWLLMTCSGTIGRVFYVPERLDGWAATHDLIRIVPHDASITGFILSWLTTTIAQAQIQSHTHGGQIDHVTDAQVGEVLVPMLPNDVMGRLHKRTMKALKARDRAMESLLAIWQEAEDALE